MAAAVPGLGMAPAGLLARFVFGVGDPGTGLGVLRNAGLTGPLVLDDEVGRFVGGLVPTILSAEGFFDQGNILKLGDFQV
ncbi:MAG: hypothetical protein ACKO9Q_12645 [Pirellula sp.]